MGRRERDGQNFSYLTLSVSFYGQPRISVHLTSLTKNDRVQCSCQPVFIIRAHGQLLYAEQVTFSNHSNELVDNIVLYLSVCISV